MRMISKLFSEMRQKELSSIRGENEAFRALLRAGVGVIGLMSVALLLSGCASTEPAPDSAWDYYGWDTNAPPMTPITNHIYRP